jgi:hypothetical protein
MAFLTDDEIDTIYARVSSKENLLYHVANGRKENSDTNYDGTRLRQISKKTVDDDIRKMREAALLFKAGPKAP